MEDQHEKFLAPPVLAAIRNEEVAARVRMERTVSQEIREERADLKEAAEQSLNVIVDLGLDGVVRWVSPSWKDVVGTSVDSIQGKPIADILEDREANPFIEAMETMKQDDSKSQIIRFRIRLGPSSEFQNNPELLASQKEVEVEVEVEVGVSGHDGMVEEEVKEGQVITLEGQGIMVYDRSSGGDSHVSIAPKCLVYECLRSIDNVDAATLVQSSRSYNRSARRACGVSWLRR